MGELGIRAYFNSGGDKVLPDESSRVIELIRSLITSKAFANRYGYDITEKSNDGSLMLEFAGPNSIINSCNLLMHLRKLGFEALSTPGMPKNLFTMYMYESDGELHKLMNLGGSGMIDSEHVLITEQGLFERYVSQVLKIENAKRIHFRSATGEPIGFTAIGPDEFFKGLEEFENDANANTQHPKSNLFGSGEASSLDEIGITPPNTKAWWESSEEIQKIWQELDSLTNIEAIAEEEFSSEKPTNSRTGGMEIAPPAEPRAPESTTKRFVRELLQALKEEESSNTHYRIKRDTAPTKEADATPKIIKPKQRTTGSNKVIQGDPFNPYIDPRLKQTKKSKDSEEAESEYGFGIILIAALLGLLAVVLAWRFYYGSRHQLQNANIVPSKPTPAYNLQHQENPKTNQPTNNQEQK